MSDNSSLEQDAERAKNADQQAPKQTFKERIFHNFREFVAMFLYLWLLFALFSLHKQLIQGHGISVWHQSFAILNALIFGKVILIGQALDVGKALDRRALIWAVLGKSLVFAILLLAFHIGEEVIRAWLESEPQSTAFVDFGGTRSGLLTVTAIFFVALIPFFAFQEAARILGKSVLWNLFFHSGAKRFHLIEN